VAPPVTGVGGGAAMPPNEGEETPVLTDDRCDVAVLDPARPPAALELTGNLGAHDPTVLEQDGVFYLYMTGGNIGAKTSTDLVSWQRQADVFTELPRPAWLEQNVPGVRNLWAPDLSFFGGQYHLYYSASTFGENTSCIGHLARASLATGAWTEQGPVVCSGNGDNYNAIDPNVVVDREGTAWLSFGSFWDGIKAIELDAAGARVGTEVISLASRGGGAIEAPVIVRRCGYYYLFVSFDTCCQGADSTYNVRVGRSENVMGPYVDREGRRLLDGGGTRLTQPDDTWRGPGHNTVLFAGDRAYNVYHAYAASNGASSLRISELSWDETGWPISGGP
jgi:arabinan endo-1,5-alpha-L-arabinosidase